MTRRKDHNNGMARIVCGPASGESRLSATRRVKTFIASILLSIPFACAASDTLDAANERTRQFIRQTMQEQRIPGLQIAVVKDNRIVLSESYGLANVENQVPLTATTLLPINSATKSFTGVAMMQLAEAGLVEIDAPISRYLGDLPEAWQGVRVRQLLAHTSGLPNIVDRQGLIGGGTELEAWKAVKDRPMDAPVGERFAYNQTNYGLLARIITKQAKMPFEQYFAEHQFAVAGMRATTFGDSYDVVPNSATIYSYSRRRTLVEGDADRLAHWIDELPPGLRTGAGIRTTADEVARWIIALSTGRLIDGASVKAMWLPEKLNGGAGGPWAAGWPVLDSSPGQRQVAGIGGGRSAFVVYPDEGLAIIVLTNLVGASPETFIPRIAEIYKPLRAGHPH
jgi:CubicO group peptidase (beta-lactamase class C family)